ncbi:LysR family transcriptional regulator [Staphylococcus succinus]|uniref:LysR family transcriptional regulator n=1 Tax=Staphylococcus succinus TaxID=61015 RepID=UPI003F5C6A87
MELRHLRYFLAIAEAGSITKAAENLHIAQPPLSRQLKDLESELGFDLFERNKKKKVTLTFQGQFFLNKSKNLLNILEDSLVESREYHEQINQTLAIGTTIYSSQIMFNQIEAFKQDKPHVRFNIWESDSVRLLQLLKERKIDVAYITEDVQADGIITETVMNDYCVCVVPQNINVCISKEEISVEELANLPLVLLVANTDSGLHKQILNSFTQRKLKANILCECHDSSMLIQLLSKGVGVTILPSATITSDILNNYTIKRIKSNPWITKTKIAWRKDSYTPKIAQTYLNENRDYDIF